MFCRLTSVRPWMSELAAANELVICFRALDRALEAKRPRPKWRTPMVESQQLRWFRTTLLGRTARLVTARGKRWDHGGRFWLEKHGRTCR